MIRTSANTVDGAAMAISGLCLLHCLALPLLASTAPVFSVLAENELVHKALVLLAVPFTLTAALGSAKLRQSAVFFVLALIGFLGLGSAAFIEALHDHEVALTIVGSGALAAAHRWRGTNLHQPKPAGMPGPSRYA